MTGDDFLTPCISLNVDPARKEEAGWIGGKNQEYQAISVLNYCQHFMEVAVNDKRIKKNI